VRGPEPLGPAHCPGVRHRAGQRPAGRRGEGDVPPAVRHGAVKFTPTGETGKDGRFTLSTAAPGDGAPPGDYVVTFELLRGGADKFGRDIEVFVWKGKYSGPAESTFKVTVKDGENALDAFRLE